MVAHSERCPGGVGQSSGRVERRTGASLTQGFFSSECEFSDAFSRSRCEFTSQIKGALAATAELRAFISIEVRRGGGMKVYSFESGTGRLALFAAKFAKLFL